MSVEQFETEVLKLAVRKVATPEGADFYGLPIGTPITPDMIAAKKAEGAAAGKLPPKNGIVGGTTSAKGKHMKGTIAGKAAAEKSKPKPQAPKPLNLKASKPTLSGNNHFKVGSSSYSAPNGSKLIRPANQPGLAYVVTKDGKIYAYTEAGEVQIPKALEAAYKAKFNADFEGDENYSVEDFEKVGASHALSELQSGMILNDQNGDPQFKKLGDDAWEHVDLGVKLKDADLQDLYDSGDLVPDTEFDDDAAAVEESFAEVDAANFSEMTLQEAQEALDKMKWGQKVTMAAESGDVVFEKNEDGTWSAPEGGVQNSKSATLAMVKNQLKIGSAPEPEYSPLDENTVDPLDENAVKPIGVGDAPDENWLKKAKPGAAFEYTPTNPNSNKTVWTKQDAGNDWMSAKGNVVDTDFLVSVSDEPDMGSMKITKDGKETPASKAAEEATKAREAAAAVGLPEPDMPDPLENVESLTGDELVGALDQADVGSKINVNGHDATLTKLEDGKWQSDLTGNSVAAKDVSYLAPVTKYEEPKEIPVEGGPEDAPETTPIEDVVEDTTVYPSMLPETMTQIMVGQELEEHLESMVEGEEIFELAQSGKEYKYVAQGEGLFTTVQPNGLEMPDTPMDEIASTGEEFGSEFYVQVDDADLDGTDMEDLNDSELSPQEIANAKDWKPGASVENVYDLAAQKPGTNVSYVDENKTVQILTKLPGDMYYDVHSGNTYAAAQLGGKVSNNKVTVMSVAPDLTADAPKHKDGDKISGYMEMDALPEGSKLAMIHDGKFLNYIVKDDKGGWKAPDEDPNWPGLQFMHGDFEPYFMGGNSSLLWTDDKDAFPGQSAALNKPEANLWEGAPEISKAQLAAALDGLNNHSSFHVKYGLKDLPEGHPLKDENNQIALKDAALAKYPDLKAKPAVVKYLSDALGVQQLPEKDADAPKIQIGSADPKKVGVQGLDGGSYTQAEIQQAVDILEAYPGKLFKSELGKKGSPLGELDPTSILGGINKDKLAAKQQYIDFLKTKLIATEPVATKPVVKDMEEFKGLPAGTTVEWHSPSGEVLLYTKTTSDGWLDEVGSLVDDDGFTPAVGKGLIQINKLPDTTPAYAKVPETVKQHSTGDALTSSDLEFMSESEIMAIPAGTKLHSLETDTFALKASADDWELYSDNGKFIDYWSPSEAHKILTKGDWNQTPKEQPSFNDNADKGIAPGKYTTPNGTAFITVKADGTGTYTTADGKTTEITAQQVANNYKTGMSTYHGMDAEVPAVTEPKKPKKAPKTAEKIADGKYFSGDPTNTKTSYYEVSGDEVKQFTPLTGITAETGVKVGQSANVYWLEKSGLGARVEYPYYAGAELKGSWTKGADGQWHNGDATKASNELFNLYWATVANHGFFEPTTLTKAKMQNLFVQGKLVDQYGNSVVPEGYSGKVKFFGKETTIPGLLKAKADLQGKTGSEAMSALTSNGVQVNIELWKKYNVDAGKLALSGQETTEKLTEAMDSMLSGLDTSIPTSDATKHFQWDELGHAQMPLELAAQDTSTMYGLASQKVFIKQASKAIGDGKIIGQHVAQMDQYDAKDWIAAFQGGDFKKMYEIEVQAAGKAGKAHASGYEHPGYPDNAGTNKIAWAPAIKGEISALEKVPGDWSSLDSGVEAPAAEIDNYLIKAQMQNPTYLSPGEKRQWVNYHRSENKQKVDQLSALAAFRKEQGQIEQSAPLTWTDDVKPAKAYDIVFENQGPFPQSWNTSAAVAYYDDNADKIPEMKALHDASPYAGGSSAKLIAVQTHFANAKAQADAEALIPVYTMKPQQTVSKSTHPIFQYGDQFGNDYFFKPSPGGDAYRSEAEHLGSELGKTFGFATADSKLLELNGKYGQLQKDVGGVNDLMGVNYATLTGAQLGDIGKEHLLDWFLDNDDTKGDNAKILPNGHIVGIDKGRAFKHFGAWNGLSGDSQMNSNANTIYAQMFDAMRAGKIDKATADQAYLAVQARALKMQKVSDEKISALLAEGMKNRKMWDIKYSIGGKKVTNDLNGLTAAVLDRKSKLATDFESMWAKVYKDAGYGDLPEAPKNPFGEKVHAGLDDVQLHTDLLKVNTHGKSTMVNGGHFVGGSVTMWNDHNTDGTQNINAEAFLAPKKQEEVLAYLQANAVNADPSKLNPTGLESHDIYGNAFVSAAKTINHHVTDGGYNQTKINEYESAKELLQKDLAAWTPTLTSNSKDGATYNFPSGQHVPMNQVDQYKLMLDHYTNYVAEIDAAKMDQTKTGIVSAYEPIGVGEPPAVFTKDGKKLTKLQGGSWIYNDGEGYVALLDGKKGEGEQAQNLLDEGGWNEISNHQEDMGGDNGVKIVYTTTHDKLGEIKDGKLSYTNAPLSTGVKGSEYEITLPTGEKIFFRNSAHTGTVTSQQGKLSFQVPNVSDPNEMSLSMARIEAQLEAMGIDASVATPESAEITYWREMFEILHDRKHETGSPYAKAAKDLDAKVAEVGGNSTHFLENLSASMTPAEEVEYWRGLWGKHFGKEKVDKLIADEAYLPQFEQGDFDNPGVQTGKPFWMRFDVDVEELQKGKLLASSAHGADTVLQVGKTGLALSTEERLRYYGKYIGGVSSLGDQGYGSSHGIYTRLKGDNELAGINFIYNPKAMARTRTYSYNADNWGKPSLKKSQAPSNPMTAQSNFSSSGNETMIPDSASLLGDLEMIIFDDIAARNEAIQEMKKKGWDSIRGLSIEDRMVMRSNLNKAVQKLRATWK